MAIDGYKFSKVTGGGTGALDGLDGAGLQDLDLALIVDPDTDEARLYLLDEDSGATADGDIVVIPLTNAGNKRWIKSTFAQNNTVPVGAIVAWIGGYFANTSNGGFVNVLGNDIVAANTYLNPTGWYVCDGNEINVSGSPLYNGSGRHLPQLTDQRFLMGASQVTGTGGNNTNSHYHGVNIPGFNSGSTTLSINQMPWHAHLRSSVNSQAGGSNTGPQYYTTKAGSTASSNTGSAGSSQGHAHWIDPPNINTGGASATENRPKFLTCFYIQKVI